MVVEAIDVITIRPCLVLVIHECFDRDMEKATG